MKREEYNWVILRDWPRRDPTTWLGVPQDMVAEVQALFQAGMVIERLTTGKSAASTEVRIPCRYGELYPVGSATWGWIGTGGMWTRKVIEAAGQDVSGPFGPEVTEGTRNEESALWFPSSQLLLVDKVVHAKRRRKTWGVHRDFAGGIQKNM